MRWPWKLGRAMDAVQALRDELERERQQHLDDVFTLTAGAGLKTIQFGNVERLWPELLDQFRELAREGGHQVLIVCGAGKCHGVYWIES